MPGTKQTGIEVQLTGQDGNIFAIMGRVKRAMRREGFEEESKEMAKEVMSCHSYSDALEIIADYVEVS